MEILDMDQIEEALEVLALCVHEPEEEKLSEIAEEYNNNPDMELYAEKKLGKIIGVIGIEKLDANNYEIKHLAVLPEHRKEGIARSLIEHVFNHKKAKMIIAETDNEAIGFYRKCKFSSTSLGEKYPGTERFRCIRIND